MKACHDLSIHRLRPPLECSCIIWQTGTKMWAIISHNTKVLQPQISLCLLLVWIDIYTVTSHLPIMWQADIIFTCHPTVCFIVFSWSTIIYEFTTLMLIQVLLSFKYTWIPCFYCRNLKHNSPQPFSALLLQLLYNRLIWQNIPLILCTSNINLRMLVIPSFCQPNTKLATTKNSQAHKNPRVQTASLVTYPFSLQR